jgi:hypothetical protein
MSESLHPSGLRVRTPDLARARPPRWAWDRRVALGCLNLLIGNEGVGKGVLMAWTIARLTRGELPGDLHGEPITVAVIADEDSFDCVWIPRLHAAGADLAHVRHLEREDGWAIDLSEDHERLTLAAELEYVRVLFLDALLDNLGTGVDDWRSKPVREALQPLGQLARERDIAVIGSMHPNKRADSFRQLMSGSIAFNAISRSSLLLAEHPDEADRRVLVRGKGNLSVTPPAVEARHTCASPLIAAGVNAKALSEIMGHSTISMTFDTYGHLMPGAISEAAAVTNAYLAKLAGGRPALQLVAWRSSWWREVRASCAPVPPGFGRIPADSAGSTL